MIRYVTGDATQPIGRDNRLIAHVVNDCGQWGAGFVVAISRRWINPELEYRRWYDRREEPKTWPVFGLGAVQFVQCRSDIAVANMLAQSNLGVNPPVRYNALSVCLTEVRDYAIRHHYSVHMPRIGCGIGGGTWSDIEPIITERLQGVDVTVYDLP